MGKDNYFIFNRKGVLKQGFIAVVLIVVMLGVLMADYALSEGSIESKIIAGDYIDTGLDKTKGISMDLVENGLTHKVLEFEITNEISAQDIQMILAENNFNALGSGALSRFQVRKASRPVYSNICNPYTLSDEINGSVMEIPNCTRVETGSESYNIEEWVSVALKAAEKVGTASLSTFNILGKGKYRYSFDTPIIKTANGWGNAGTVFLNIDNALYADKQHSSWWNISWAKKRTLNVTNNENFATDDIRVKFIINTSEGFKSDCSDLVIIDEISNEIFDWANETACGNANTVFWFRNASISALGTKQYTLYYNNPDAAYTPKHLQEIERSKNMQSSITLWRFDGNLSDDSNLSSNDGLGVTTFVNGKLGQAMNLTTADTMAFANHTLWDGLSAGTITFWWRYSSHSDGGVLLGSEKTGEGGNSIRFWIGDTKQFDIANQALTQFALPHSITWGPDFRHVALTWNSSTMKIYLNGLEYSSTSFSGKVAINNTNYLYLGKGSPDWGVGGAIDDFRALPYDAGQAAIKQDALAANFSASLGPESSMPMAPIVSSMSILPSPAYTNDNLNCSFTVTDANAEDTLTANISWYNGTSVYKTYLISVSNGTLVSNVLNAGNTTKGQTWNCSVVAYDGKAYSNAASAAVAILNSAPVFAPVVSFSLNEDFGNYIINLASNVSDADNDALTIGYALDTTDYVTVNVNNGTKTTTFYSVQNAFGVTNVSFIVYDDDMTGDSVSFLLTVNPINDMPVIGSYNASNSTYVYPNTPNVYFSEGENTTFAVDASDVEGSVWYSWFVDNVLQPLEHNSWLSHLWDFLSAGMHIVRVDVNDSDNAKTNQTWNVNIANVVNKFWSVDYVSPPTPSDKENLTSQAVNISVLVTPSLIGTTEAKTIFHNATDFNVNGLRNFTEINTTEKAVQLSYANLSGTYTSNISDMGEIFIWDNISWSEYLPSDGELSPSTGMAGLWHMNNNWLDASGNGNDGTAYNGASFTTDAKLGSHAGSFDGADDYVSVPSSSGDELDIKSDMTVTAWIKWKGPSDPPDIYYPRIMEKDYQASYMFSLRPDDATRLSVWLMNSERASTPAGSVSLNEWHHVGFTFNDTSDAVKLYVDGVEKGSGSYTGAISGSANNVFIGRYPGGSVALFNGSIDDMAIWNRSLAAEEIQGIYNATAGGIRMQARSCDDSLCDGESFVGSSGEGSYYTNASYESLSGIAPNRYFQYKAFFETNDALVSPLLYNVTVKAHTQQALEDVSINNAWIDFNGGIYNMSGAGLSWSYANNTLEPDTYTYTVYVNDTFGNLNMTMTRVFTVPSYNITFNVTDGDTGLGLNNINVTCDYSGFNKNEDTTPYDNPYGAYTFPVGTWQCNFKDTATKPQYWDKTLIFVVTENKNISVVLSFKGGLSYEEHTQLDWLYNCWRYGECDAYTKLSGIYENVSRIWNEFIPTNISVVAIENITSKTLSASSNITIDYTLNVPYKKGVEDKALLPIRIFYWFTNSNGTCYNQDKQTESNRAETPFCIPLMAEYLGPNNGTTNFTVVLKPNLSYGTYEVVRQIDIDPPVNGVQTWINYGREVIGNINVANLLTETTHSTSENAVSNKVIAESPSIPDQGLNLISGASTVIPESKLTYNGWFVTLWLIIISTTILGSIYIKSRYK